MTRDQNTDPRNMSGPARAEFGVIVSFETADGGRLTVHRHGPIAAALRDASDYALYQDPGYRVVAVSTPSTIMADLAMRQHRHIGRYHDTTAQLPDKAMLGTAGIVHLMHPRYMGSV